MRDGNPGETGSPRAPTSGPNSMIECICSFFRLMHIERRAKDLREIGWALKVRERRYGSDDTISENSVSMSEVLSITGPDNDISRMGGDMYEMVVNIRFNVFCHDGGAPCLVESEKYSSRGPRNMWI